MTREEQWAKNKEVYGEYLDGQTHQYLAKKYGQSEANILRIIKKYKAKGAQSSTTRNRPSNLYIYQQYESGVDVAMILRTCNISKETFDKIIVDGIAGEQDDPVKHFTRFTWPKPVTPKTEVKPETQLPRIAALVKTIKMAILGYPISKDDEEELIDLICLWRKRSELDEEISSIGDKNGNN
jgi:hypothetical protein